MRYDEPSKYSPVHNSHENEGELEDAMSKMSNAKPKVRGCLACDRGNSVDLGHAQTQLSADSQSIPRVGQTACGPCNLTLSNSLKRTDVNAARDTLLTRQRMRLAHKQTSENMQGSIMTQLPEMPGRDSDKQRNNHPVLLQPFHIKFRDSWEAFYKMDKRDAIVGTNNGYCEGTYKPGC